MANQRARRSAKSKGRHLSQFPPEHWRLSAWQKRVWDDSADLDGASVFDMCCGRGSGKDIIAIRCVLRDAFKLWRRYKKQEAAGESRVRNPRVKIWVIAPQKNNIKQAWSDWHGELVALAKAWRLGWADESEESSESGWLFRESVREEKFILLGKGEIEIELRLSSTKDALRGAGVDVCHWTETAVETVPGELERAYDEELSGTMVRANRHGRIYRTTTPKGPFGGYYKMIKREFGDAVVALENDSMRSESGLEYAYNFDAYSNEFLTEVQKTKIRAEVKHGWIYDQERRARFVIGDKGGTKAFSRESVYGCVVDLPVQSTAASQQQAALDPATRHRRPAITPNKLRRVTFGVDIARYGDDWTVYCGVDQDTVEIVHLERREQMSGQAVVKDIERLAAAYPGCFFRVDSTGHKGYIADFLPTDLQQRVIETEFSRLKEKWVLGLELLLATQQIRIPNPEKFPGIEKLTREALRMLLRELLAFVKIVKQNGNVVYTHPPGENDDTVDALILATMDQAERIPGAGGHHEETLKRLQSLNV